MNYYKLQTTYFIVFIALGLSAIIAIPMVTNSLNDFSDSYAMNEMKKIQSEMIFHSARNGQLHRLCYEGRVGGLISELIKEHGEFVSCNSNTPQNTAVIVCSQLKNKSYFCVDSAGISCQVYNNPSGKFLCKSLN